MQQRDLDGIYFKVYRDNKWQNVCLSDMTKEERREVLKNFNKDSLIRTIDHLCFCLYDIADGRDIYEEMYRKLMAHIESANKQLEEMIDRIDKLEGNR